MSSCYSYMAEKNKILYPEKGKDNFKTVFRIRILADAGFSNDPDPGFIKSEPDLEKKDQNPKHYFKTAWLPVPVSASHRVVVEVDDVELCRCVHYPRRENSCGRHHEDILEGT